MIDQIVGEKKVKIFFSKERKNQDLWRFVDWLDMVCVNKNSFFINYL
jgi:hypothetical protein